jgi:putative addiction module component (TIGR02574 family)
MSLKVKEVMDSIRSLSSDERATLAHCLITSLDQPSNDQGIDEAWQQLVEQRLVALESGAVQGVSWDQLKNEVVER